MEEAPSEKGRRARKGTLASLEAQGYTGEGVAASELSHRGCNGALDSLEAEGFTREEASYVHGHRGYDVALDSLVKQGYSMEEAPDEKGRRGYDGALDSLEAEGFTREEASSVKGRQGRNGAVNNLINEGADPKKASTELAIRHAANRREAGTCKFPGGCSKAIRSSEFCDDHQPTKLKAEKSDQCGSCGRVLGVEVRVVGGVCYLCYQKPEAKVARKKAMADKKAARGGDCSTTGCEGSRYIGRDICQTCYRNSLLYRLLIAGIIFLISSPRAIFNILRIRRQIRAPCPRCRSTRAPAAPPPSSSPFRSGSPCPRSAAPSSPGRRAS